MNNWTCTLCTFSYGSLDSWCTNRIATIDNFVSSHHCREWVQPLRFLHGCIVERPPNWKEEGSIGIGNGISEHTGMKITQATTIVEHFVLGQSTVDRQALWHTALSFVMHCGRILKWGNGIGKIRTTGTLCLAQWLNTTVLKSVKITGTDLATIAHNGRN